MHPIEHLRYIARAQGVDAASLARETAVALGSLRADPANLVVACRRIVERHVAVAPIWWLCAELLTSDSPDGLAWELVEALDDDPTADLLAEALAVAWPGTATVVTVGHPEVIATALVERADVVVSCIDSGYRATSLLQRLERGLVECEPVPPESIGHAVGAADVVLVEGLAVAPGRVLAPVGSLAPAASAALLGIPVWLVAPMGTRLPAQYVDAIARSVIDDVAPLHREFDELPVALFARVVTADRDADPDDPASALSGNTPFAPELLRIGSASS